MEQEVSIMVNFLPRTIEAREFQRKISSSIAGLKDVIRNSLKNKYPQLDSNDQIKILIFAKSYPDNTTLLQVYHKTN